MESAALYKTKTNTVQGLNTIPQEFAAPDEPHTRYPTAPTGGPSPQKPPPEGGRSATRCPRGRCRADLGPPGGPALVRAGRRASPPEGGGERRICNKNTYISEPQYNTTGICSPCTDCCGRSHTGPPRRPCEEHEGRACSAGGQKHPARAAMRGGCRQARMLARQAAA